MLNILEKYKGGPFWNLLELHGHNNDNEDNEEFLIFDNSPFDQKIFEKTFTLKKWCWKPID